MIYKSTPRHLPNEEVSKLETVKENEQLSIEEKMRRVKEAKGGTWYNNWKPYCCACSYSDKMIPMPYGFRCPECGNMIGWNLTRLQESPLNK